MTRLGIACAVAAALIAGTYVVARAQTAQAKQMSFFITSANPGNGANLGGLSGADAYCATLAKAAGAGNREWRAYLSTNAGGGGKVVNAKDRIGSGPWFNSKGVQIAASVAELHSDKNNLTKETQLTEKGAVLNGRGDTPNMHDILTGSNLDGTASENTCNNWTSGAEGSAMLGHHDRQGGGANPTSWNSAHASKGCSLDNLKATGGDGRFYCFAVK